MRKSMDERIKEGGSNKRQIQMVNRYFDLNVADLLDALSSYTDRGIDRGELLGYVDELLDKCCMDDEIEELSVRKLLRLLLSLHRTYDEYSEHEQRLLETFLMDAIIL